MKQILKHAEKPALPANLSYHLTCVFLLLCCKKEPKILAILKSDNEGYPWRNQVALPGGHIEKDDLSPVDAAYRELEEELNIKRKHVEFIGSLGHFQTINNKDIEVFIGLWDKKESIRYDFAEIAKVLEIPLKTIVETHSANHYHGWTPDIGDLLYPFDDLVIWGVTAKILHHFIEILYPFMALS